MTWEVSGDEYPLLYSYLKKYDGNYLKMIPTYTKGDLVITINVYILASGNKIIFHMHGRGHKEKIRIYSDNLIMALRGSRIETPSDSLPLVKHMHSVYYRDRVTPMGISYILPTGEVAYSYIRIGDGDTYESVTEREKVHLEFTFPLVFLILLPEINAFLDDALGRSV